MPQFENLLDFQNPPSPDLVPIEIYAQSELNLSEFWKGKNRLFLR